MTDEKKDSDWIDPDDAPELDDDWFNRAEVRIGREVIRKSLPPGSAKRPVLRRDPEVIAYFRKSGPGWQTRMNDMLRKAAGL